MNKRICYVLTGGSLRGICGHIAAITALERAGLHPSAVVGTSAGAIVGGLYAAGMTPEAIQDAVANMRRKDYIDPDYVGLIMRSLMLGHGLTGIIKGQAMLKWFKSHLPVDDFAATRFPLGICTTNITQGTPELITSGKISSAMRASSAIPFFFKPQKIGTSYYVDGGVVNNVPLDEAIQAFPGFDAYLVITTLGLAPDPYSLSKESNEWRKGFFTPVHMLISMLEAGAYELAEGNLNASGRPVVVFKTNPGRIGIKEIEKANAAIELAKPDAFINAQEIVNQLVS